MSSQSVYKDANDAFFGTLKNLISIEPDINAGAGDTLQTLPTREELNYSFTLNNPRSRLTTKLPLHIAVARLVWMMSANNRVEDIAFYEPRVRNFSDDTLTVPGSNYGMRLRQPQAGLDQIVGLIERIKKEPSSRRTAVVIYQACDAVRESKDIPCAFGMFFSPRKGRLNASLIMRSNNAAALLPFNIFEFSMLLEIVAVEAKLELGNLFYFANSMHLFERDVDRIKGLVSHQNMPIPSMKPMPSNVSPLDQLSKLAAFEAELRHGSAALDESAIAEWCDRLAADFDVYWSQLGLLLVSAVAARVSEQALRQVTARLDKTLRPFAPSHSAAQKPLRSPDVKQESLFAGLNDENIRFLHRANAAREFAQHAERYEKDHGIIGAKRLLQAQGIVLDRLAARGEDETVSFETFENALKSV